MEEKIKIEHLTHDYGHGRGVFDVTFNVHEGEVFGFLGPNGAGKSTTIRHLMGFTKPQSGSTELLGVNSFKHGHEVLGKVGYIPGEVALPAGLTGWEFLDMMKKMRNLKDDTLLNQLLEMFEVNPNGDTKRMSFGGKRKLAIVTAFMHDPEVLILDEPTSGLDPIMQETFVKYIKEEKRRGKTILLSSHIFSEINDTSDRIAIIKDGKIVSHFHAESFKHTQNKTYVITVADAKAMEILIEEIKNVPEIKIVDKKNLKSIVVNLDLKDMNKFISVVSKCPVLDFEEIKETLEQYFMKYYKEDGGEE